MKIKHFYVSIYFDHVITVRNHKISKKNSYKWMTDQITIVIVLKC